MGQAKEWLIEQQWREDRREQAEEEGIEPFDSCVCGECLGEWDLYENVPGGLWCARYGNLTPEHFKIRRARDLFAYHEAEISGYVYVLKAGEYYKIGRSKTPDERIKTLQIQLPFPVEVVELIPCDDEVEAERELHNCYARLRVNGEWFKDLPVKGTWMAYINGEVHV